MKIHERIASAESELKNLSKAIDDSHKEDKEQHAQIIALLKAQNGRVRVNEQWRYTMAGGLIVIMALIIPMFLQIFKVFLTG